MMDVNVRKMDIHNRRKNNMQIACRIVMVLEN